MSGGGDEIVNLRDVWMSATQLLEKAGIGDARFEAEVLLRHATSRNRAQFYATLTDPMTKRDFDRFFELLEERIERRPLAYITGSREFYRLEFRVTPDVLIPRPETELLVDTALDHLRKARVRGARIADVGAGSGAVGIAIAHHRRGARLVATDISAAALTVARDNADRLLRRAAAHFVQGDLLTPLQGPFHCIVANLPYIPEERLPQLEPEVAQHEPRQALTPGTSGTELQLRLLTQLRPRLAPNGIAVLELDPGQEDILAASAAQLLPDATVRVLNDFSERPRALSIVA